MNPIRSAFSTLATIGRIAVDGARRSLATAYLLHHSRCQAEELLRDMERAKARAAVSTANSEAY